jgi:dCMP deaminase
MQKEEPRKTPDRDSKYMGLAWIHAGFSKDPKTQVGAQIVDKNNMPLGSGYNGPPRSICDSLVIWDRPSQDKPDSISKYDFIIHAEINAIDHSFGFDLSNSTLYVTALPCPKCMLEIVKKEIPRVVYFDYKSHVNSSLQSDKYRDKTFEIAKLGGVNLEKFKGSLNWIKNWNNCLENLKIFEM